MDHRETEAGRRQSWHGAKRYAKRVLGWRVPNAAMRAAIRVRPSAASPRLPAPVHITEVEGRIGDARFFMLRPDRCVVAKELYWGKGRRPGAADQLALEVFERLAARSDTSTVVDIGAYTGIFTLLSVAANPTLHAHAFEIVPEVFLGLFENVVRNDVLPRVTLHPAGIGEPGTVTMPVNYGGSALPDFLSTSTVFTEGVTVPVRSLDSLLPELPGDGIVIVKIDVEGTEDRVLAHGQHLLAERRPDILCEVLAGVADPIALENLLEPHGYHFFKVGETELRPSRRIRPDTHLRDWLFTTLSDEELRDTGVPVGTTEDS